MINTEAVSSPIRMNYPLIYGFHLPGFLMPLLAAIKSCLIRQVALEMKKSQQCMNKSTGNEH